MHDLHAPPLTTRLAVNGLNCGNCARKVSEIIQAYTGVASVDVSLDEQQVSVRWNPGAKPDLPPLLAALKHGGYPSRPVTDGSDKRTPKMGGWALNLAVGGPVTAALTLGEWVLRLGEARWFAWVSFALAGIVQFVAGARFYRGAWVQLKAGGSNMDTLVALGSTTAFGYSAWALLAGWAGHLYFMEAVAIITLISLGHWTEARVAAKASASLKALMALAPQTARKRTGDSIETEVPVSMLQPEDFVVLRPGDRVPVDGEVVEGASLLDESMLTGESAPVEKAAGSPLYAGTVNLDGQLVLRVKAIGESTAIAHIIAVVQRAQNSRASIQRLGDRVSNFFVPAACLIAAGAALWWGLAYESAKGMVSTIAPFLWHVNLPATPFAAAAIAASAVLIVACPCAMGLATPAAIMAAANVAARRGILIRDGVALEKAGWITGVLFDKTGTLTTGKPVVVQTWVGNRADAAALAAVLARHSAHPVSRALAQYPSATAELSSWREVRGAGLEASIRANCGGWEAAKIGSVRWLADAGVLVAAADPFIQEWTAQGATIVGLAVKNRLAGLFAVQDDLKSGAKEVLRRLHKRGLKTYLVTGDSRATAVAIARRAGIPAENVFAEVRPEDKAVIVQRMQAEGQRVAFVGDGINDAPALTQADLGIAVCKASDVAQEAADIILLKSEIEAVPESLGLARATLKTIKQNLFWAFFYNVASVPLAALGFISPVVCAAAMGVSDLIVLGNALRLSRWKLRD